MQLDMLGTALQLWPVTLAGIPVIEGNMNHFSDLYPIIGGHGSYTKARHGNSDGLVFCATQRFRKKNKYLALKSCSLILSPEPCGANQFGLVLEVAEIGP